MLNDLVGNQVLMCGNIIFIYAMWLEIAYGVVLNIFHILGCIFELCRLW